MNRPIRRNSAFEDRPRSTNGHPRRVGVGRNRAVIALVAAIIMAACGDDAVAICKSWTGAGPNTAGPLGPLGIQWTLQTDCGQAGYGCSRRIGFTDQNNAQSLADSLVAAGVIEAGAIAFACGPGQAVIPSTAGHWACLYAPGGDGIPVGVIQGDAPYALDANGVEHNPHWVDFGSNVDLAKRVTRILNQHRVLGDINFAWYYQTQTCASRE